PSTTEPPRSGYATCQGAFACSPARCTTPRASPRAVCATAPKRERSRGASGHRATGANVSAPGACRRTTPAATEPSCWHISESHALQNSSSEAAANSRCHSAVDSADAKSELGEGEPADMEVTIDRYRFTATSWRVAASRGIQLESRATKSKFESCPPTALSRMLLKIVSY